MSERLHTSGPNKVADRIIEEMQHMAQRYGSTRQNREHIFYHCFRAMHSLENILMSTQATDTEIEERCIHLAAVVTRFAMALNGESTSPPTVQRVSENNK